MKKERIIICDNCGINMTTSGIQIVDKVLERDQAGNPVTEKYFDCQHCGKHYNITITDSEVRKMIRQRQQIRQIIEKLVGGGKKKIGQYEKLLEKDKALEKKQIERVNMLKEKYLK